MLSNKEIIVPNNLLNFAHKKKGVKVGIEAVKTKKVGRYKKGNCCSDRPRKL